MKRLPAFSMVELVVAITISGIVLSMVMTSYSSLSKTTQRLNLARQMQREVVFSMARITDRCRRAENFVVENGTKLICDDATFTIAPPTPAAQKNTLTMKIGEHDTQPLLSDLFAVEWGNFETVTSGHPLVQVQLRVHAPGTSTLPPLVVRTSISSRQY